MKTWLYSVLIVLLLSNSQQLLASNVLQEPEAQHQFEPNFQEKYTGRKYNYEGKETVQSNVYPVKGKASKYKNVDPKLKEEDNSNQSSIDLSFINYIYIFVLIIAVLYLLYILFNEGGNGLFVSGKHRKLNDFGEFTSETIQSADVQTLIDQAENNNNFRLAIRYYYILVLKLLSLKNLIRFEENKTNADYLNEIAHLKFSTQFAYTSYLYNYIWYGEFPLNTEQYQTAKQSFKTLLDDMQ